MRLAGPTGRVAAMGVVLAVASIWLASRTSAATLEVGRDQQYPVPSAAAAVARDGDRIVIARGSYSDCAVWKANSLKIEGAGADDTVISGRPCAGKALFIVQGANITIRGLALTNAHVEDFNGAGIRAEGGDLTVEGVRFENDEDGILAGALPGTQIVVRDSTFIRDGTCEGGGGCAHGIYVGHIAVLRVEHSRFFETRDGHQIKSRAERTAVVGCTMEDGAGGTSSFAVDVPNGGAVVVRDSRIEKGPKSGNHTAAIVIGAEGVINPTPEIVISHNTLLVEGSYSSYLLDNRTSTKAALSGNTLRGNALGLHGAGDIR